jgi:hypothetical protein
MSEVCCLVYERREKDGGFSYDQVGVDGPSDRFPHLYTTHPPVVGDLITLTYVVQGLRSVGTYRVVERSWLHAAYGSVAWPRDQVRPVEPTALHLIVEEADRPFADEVDS